VLKIVALYNFSIPRDKDDREFRKLIIKRNIDVCRMAKGNKGDQIGKLIMDEIAKYIDFEIDCPFKKVISYN
jgi:hypothetical protein